MAILYWDVNLKFLRERKRISQQEIANSLNIPRSTYSGYENKVGQPAIQTLIAIADYYKISLEALLKIDLSKLNYMQLRQYFQNDESQKKEPFEK
jgi:transcriptional regulator with XRE-family HTH domain